MQRFSSLFFLVFIAQLQISSVFAQSTSAPIIALVTNFKDKPQEGEQILFVGTKTGETYSAISNTQGKFSISLPGPEIYEIKIKAIGSAQDYSTIEIPKLAAGQGYGTMKLTIKFELPKTITLENVLFDTGKSSLKSSSFSELDEVVAVMTRKKTMQIEVGGHTDSIGSEASNVKLSQDRADAVRNYLISKGIDATRISAVGYGEALPVADNKDEKGRALNRRTEIRILKN